MGLTLTRTAENAHATLGQLTLNGLALVTLEDPPGTDRILAGSYGITLSFSNRFQVLLPEIAVPGRTGLSIHAGNTEADTTGCILVGSYRVSDTEIAASRIALAKLLTVWREWVDERITVVEAFA